LQQQQYCIANRQVSKDEYQAQLAGILASFKNCEAARKTWRELAAQRIHRWANNTKIENCTGDFLSNSKDCRDCYDVDHGEHCRYVTVGVSLKDCYDCSNVYLGPELNYQVLGAVETFNCAFSVYVIHCQDALYSDCSYNCRHIFGCEGLRRKEFCVLNRQYSEKEYRTLVPRIIEHMKNTGEWGEFFSPAYSPHCYNESLAYEYFPLSREEVLARGWHWQDVMDRELPAPTLQNLPDATGDIPATICTEVLKCSISGAPYRMVAPELDFYLKLGLPLPRKCPDERRLEREHLRNPRKLWPRECGRCGGAIYSTYAPERSESIYCEKCFTANVY
jgi:hypothetical protein